MGRPVRVLLAAALAVSLTPAQAAHAVRAPRLGDWEGRGPHGLALSFRLTRRHHLVAIKRGITLMLPVLCPAGPLEAVAVHYDDAGYSGPGAPPLPIFHFRRRQLSIDVIAPSTFESFVGTLRSRRKMILHVPVSTDAIRGCGWPRHRARFVVHHAHRAPVRTGDWSGTLSGAGGITGTVHAHVTDHGRIVDEFDYTADCPAGGATGVTAPQAAEFVRPGGGFAGPVRAPVRLAGALLGWRGRFRAGALTGTVTLGNPCDNALLVAPFSALRATGTP